MRWALATGLAASIVAAFAGHGNAAGRDDLSRITVTVTGASNASRALGFASAIEEVLIRVSGDPRLASDPRLAAIKAKAARYVKTYSARDEMEGIPHHDEQGTRDRPYDMDVTFDPTRIATALHTLGRRPWTGPRPTLVVLLAVEDLRSAHWVLASDDPAAEGQRLSLASAAELRGIPMILPTSAALAERGVTFERLVAAPSLELEAKDFGGDLSLVGRLVWSEAETGWVADWWLALEGKSHHWQIRGVRFDLAFRNAMSGAALLLSRNGEPDATLGRDAPPRPQ